MSNKPEINSMENSLVGHDRDAPDCCADSALSRRHFLAVVGSASASLLFPDLLLSTAPGSGQSTYPTVADSVRDFSGSQGYHGWYYGYTVDQYSLGSFHLMPHFFDAGDGKRTWFVDPTNYLTRLSADGGNPNGIDIVANRSPDVHLPVRRWVSRVNDKVEISGTLALLQPDASSDGVTGSIYADGRLLWTQALDRNMPSSDFRLELRVAVDMRIDFVVAPGASSTGDSFLFNAQIAQGGCSDCCFSQPPVRFFQNSSPWGSLTYDHKTPADGDHTIGDVGCALTALSMALFYAGFINDPQSLNTLLINNKGYDGNHGVRFDDSVRAVRKVSGKNFVWTPVSTDSTFFLANIICGAQDPLPGVFNNGFPVIVGVHRNSKPGEPFRVTHYVLVTGFRRDNPSRTLDFEIIDPGSSQVSRLSHYQNRFLARGFVIDPPGELSGLNVDVANASLIITDSAGRRTGFDATLGSIIEIPQSVAYGDSLTGDISNTPSVNFSSYLSILQPPSGSYNLDVTGVIGEAHQVSIRGYSDDGTAQDEVIVPINAPAGETVSLQVRYESAPGSVPEVTIEKIVAVEVLRRSINLDSTGIILVAILSTPTFDATEVDPLSVRFGPAEASETHGRGHLEDTNGDGRKDLLLHFGVQESGVTANLTEVCLKGRTRSGTPVKGCTTIRVTPH